MLKMCIFYLLLSAVASCGNGINSNSSDTGSGTGATPNAFKKMIATPTGSGGNLGGVSGADVTCDQLLAGSKALIGSAARDKNNDWVLKPNTEYRRSDGTTIIGTTNSSAVFDFPLTNSMTTSNDYWTGLNVDWTFASDNCNNWSDGGAFNGFSGNGTVTDSRAIKVASPTACFNSIVVICVEQ